MNATMLIALVIAIPVILLPAALIWYLNIGGLARAFKEQKEARESKVSGTE